MATLERAPLFSRESLKAKEVEPKNAQLLASSRELGWSSLLLDSFEAHGRCDDYERRLTPDIRLVIALSGSWDISARYGGRWNTAVLQAGAVAVNDGGQSMRLRWRNRHPTRPFRLAAIYLPKAFLEEAADELRLPGQRLDSSVSSSLVLNDAVIGATLAALVRANKEKTNDLYAEQGARWLATHLIHAHGKPHSAIDDQRHAGVISDHRLARVLDFMQENLALPITLADMARVASVSPFHFSRIFHKATGLSPQRYLTEQRLIAAESMIRTSAVSINDIAGMCGYARHAAFSAAFFRRFGATPTEHRQRSHR
jgi:AraC family transcriptional regulator